MTVLKCFVIFLSLTGILFSGIQLNAQVNNYINLVRSIKFMNEDYELAWSSNPSEGYFKQEYIRVNDNLERYNKMIIIEIAKEFEIDYSVESQIRKIVERKRIDPVANYQLLENKTSKEYLLDFVFHENGIYEWNAYRYMIYDQEGNSGMGVQLLAISIRGFEGGELEVSDFLHFLQDGRENVIHNLLKLELPELKVKE